MAEPAPNPWSGAYGKVVDAWSAVLLTPAFALILAGFAAYAYLSKWTLKDLQSLTETQLATLAVALLLVATTLGQVMDRLSRSLLRAASGYWGLHSAWGRRGIKRHRAALLADERRFSELLGNTSRTREEQEELVRLGARINRHPMSDRVMPTRLGNVLRAAEDRPRERYGLDSVVCWPRLWPQLPETVRATVKDAHASLVLALQFGAWSLLLVPVALGVCAALVLAEDPEDARLAIVLGAATLFALLLSRLAYVLAVRAAEAYADAYVAAFDTHRNELYKSLRWPLPRSPREELTRSGPHLSAFLWEGTSPRGFTYDTGKAEEGEAPTPAPPSGGRAT